MDLSEDYIFMCEKAEEIQKLVPIGKNQYFQSAIEGSSYGDVAYADYDGTWVVGLYDDDVQFMTKDQFIWLPRQDQLQEIVGFITPSPANMETIIEYHKIAVNLSFFKLTATWEKFWLMFAMAVLYKKTWNEKEWVAK